VARTSATSRRKGGGRGAAAPDALPPSIGFVHKPSGKEPPSFGAEKALQPGDKSQRRRRQDRLVARLHLAAHFNARRGELPCGRG
jgi:hypothetical protein